MLTTCTQSPVHLISAVFQCCAVFPAVFQWCQHQLVPIITRIVNLSLQGGQLTDKFKVGVIKPLLKKSGADHENFSNFRPVSNLYFLSQVI